MATALDVLAPLRAGLIAVPAQQRAVCSVCRNGIDPAWPLCPSCNKAHVRLGSLDPIIPVSLSIHGEQLHFALRKYKDADDADIRQRMALRLAALLTVFVHYHSKCLGDWDIIVPVPSTSRNALTPVLDMTPHRKKVVELLHPSDDFDPDGRDVDPARFSVDSDPRGTRVLLLDDTFTTGASMFSARAALMNAGAVVVQAVVLGRHIRPDKWPPAEELLSWLRGRPWNPEQCCICSGEYRTVPSLF